MRKASEYGRGILSILSRSLRTAIDLLGLLGLVWGCAIVYELIRTKGNIQMTMESSILAWGAIFLLVGFVGSFIAYTILFLMGKTPHIKQNGNGNFDRLKVEIGLLKKRVKSLEKKVVNKNSMQDRRITKRRT